MPEVNMATRGSGHEETTDEVADSKPIREQAERLSLAAAVVSSMFLEAPAADLVRQLAAPAAAQQWPLEDARARAALTAAASRPDTEEELRQDHFRLFLGPGRGLACPFGSVYLSRDGLLFGSETDSVKQFYRELGLTWAGEGPADHIGLQVAWVGEVAKRIVAIPEQEILGMRLLLGRFLAEHLQGFAPFVLERVTKNARTAAYAALPALADSVLGAAARIAVSQPALATN